MIHLTEHRLPHGITLAGRSTDNGRPRVIFLHGFPEAAFVWDEVMLQLAHTVSCLAPNLRGYPGSSAPQGIEAYRARQLVADVAALIESFGQPLDLLVAHDWGGALAWSLAAVRPELLRRLLIINSPHPATFLRELRNNPAQQAASAYMHFLCRPDAAKLLAADGHARLWPFLGGAAWLTPALREQYRRSWQQGLEGPLNYYRASPLRPPVGPDDDLHRLVLPEILLHVRVPTTVLWGELDVALLPGLLQGLVQWVPALRIQRVPDASHWIVHEQPDLVAQQVKAELAAGAAPQRL